MKNLSSRASIFYFLFLVFLALSLPKGSVQATNPLDVVINEIAWMGTKADSSDEWIELYNNTNQAISLEGWGLYEEGGKTLIEPLTGIIEAKSYYLIERTDDTTIDDIPASQTPSSWGGYGLKNSGEHLQLLDQNSTIIDEVNCSGGWFAGEASPNYSTTERKDSQGSGSDPNNWATNNGSVINGKDSEGNPINGTPKAKNSLTIEPQPETEAKLSPQEETPAQEQIEQPRLEPITYPSGILINEILPSPTGPDELEEWIEIFNQNGLEVDLSNWQIGDAIGKTTTYTFPKGTIISGKGFLVLTRPTTKITLNNDGDGLNLIRPDGKIIDSVNYQKAPRGQSYNKAESGWIWSTILTPGSTNIIPAQVSEIKKEIEEPTLKEEIREEETKKGLAAIGEQIPKKDFDSLFIFLIASAIAIFSGIIILVLKKKIKRIDFLEKLN